MNVIVFPISIVLPLLAVLPLWFKGWRATAVAWFVAGVVVPWLVFVASLIVLAGAPMGDPGEGSPGDGLGILFVSMAIAVASWLALAAIAFFVGLRRPPKHLPAN